MDWEVFWGILLATSPLFFNIYKYVDTKKRDQDLREFETYHKLIRELVQPDNKRNTMYVDRQTAIIFELRNFKRYYAFSYRTLTGLKKVWSRVKYPRLFEELDLTLDFLKKKI